MSEEIYQCGLYTHPPKKCRITSCPFCKGERPVMSIDWTKPVEALKSWSELPDAVEVRVLCTDYGVNCKCVLLLIGQNIFCCELDGTNLYYVNGGYRSNFLLRNRKTKKEGWINLYETGSGGRMPSVLVYPTKEESEKQVGWADGYVATIKIEWEE